MYLTKSSMYVLRLPSKEEKKIIWLWSWRSTQRAKCRVPTVSASSIDLRVVSWIIKFSSLTPSQDFIGMIKLAGDITRLVSGEFIVVISFYAAFALRQMS